MITPVLQMNKTEAQSSQSVVMLGLEFTYIQSKLTFPFSTTCSSLIPTAQLKVLQFACLYTWQLGTGSH